MQRGTYVTTPPPYVSIRAYGNFEKVSGVKVSAGVTELRRNLPRIASNSPDTSGAV